MHFYYLLLSHYFSILEFVALCLLTEKPESKSTEVSVSDLNAARNACGDLCN